MSHMCWFAKSMKNVEWGLVRCFIAISVISVQTFIRWSLMEIQCGINCFSPERNESLRVNHHQPVRSSDCMDHSFGNTGRSTLSSNHQKPLMTSRLIKRRMIKASLKMRIRMTTQGNNVTVPFSASEGYYRLKGIVLKLWVCWCTQLQEHLKEVCSDQPHYRDDSRTSNGCESIVPTTATPTRGLTSPRMRRLQISTCLISNSKVVSRQQMV